MENVLAVFEQQIDHLERMRSQAERQMMLGNNAVANAIKADKARFAIGQIYACINKIMEAQPSRDDIKDSEGDLLGISDEYELFPSDARATEHEDIVTREEWIGD